LGGAVIGCLLLYLATAVRILDGVGCGESTTTIE